jgi:K+ transporter
MAFKIPTKGCSRAGCGPRANKTETANFAGSKTMVFFNGFMERPDIPASLEAAHASGCGINLSDVTYYVGHETVVPSDSDKRLPRWVEALFAAMQRNSVHVSEYFKLPRDAIVEIGREVAI